MYKIVCVYGCYAAALHTTGGALPVWRDPVMADYFDEYTTMVCADKAEADQVFAAEYGTSDVSDPVYDFSDGVDCVAVTAYELRRYADPERYEVISVSAMPSA